ncbi:hypothetical protein E1B28_002553 [Marasmius oreades]|uniref:Nucleolar protein 16 n=1 Tax=Marasmius oreades TaxID=181124 RepID=A0A9P7RMV3_9AGAR|nr:uncharacterized protein E1B28_002553 [Marasmius oreades]KAG7086609.1 hypothetical protein E1B28_002553 [Marasmius oreades]
MANPRQRRKSRSSSHRPVSHSKNAKRTLKKMPTIRAPKVLQDAWDKNKTVRQNYAALGLIHDLNPSAAGGAEVVDVDINQNDQTTHPITDSAVSSTSENGSQGTSALGAGKPALPPQGSTIPKGYGRIVRDEVGNVVRIDYSDEEHNDKLVDKRYQDVDTNMEQLEPELDTSIKEKWIEGMGRQTGRAQVIVKKHFVEGESCDRLWDLSLSPVAIRSALLSLLRCFSIEFTCHRVYLYTRLSPRNSTK